MRFRTRYLAAFGVGCALFCTAIPAFADSLSAGFPVNPIWVSSTNLTDGDTATINTLIYNSSSDTITGDVVFTMDNTSLGTKQFSSAPGTNQTISYSWTAVEGTHDLSAYIENENASGEVTTELASTQAGTTTVTVAPTAPPPAAVAYASNATTVFVNTIASSSPTLANIASTTISTAEDVRESALSSLQSLASSTEATGSVDGGDTQASSPPAGEVLGIFNYRAPANTTAAAGGSGISSFFAKLWAGTLAFLIAICSSPLWFYLLLLVVIVLLVKLVMTILSDRKRSRRRR